MFEARTYETIMEEMLDSTDQSIDTRQGSIIYDATAPTAMENAQMYVDMDILLNETFADTASYYYLIKRAAERGIFVKEGNPAVLKAKVEPSDVNIPIDTEFNIGELNYFVNENLGDGYYSLTCRDIGVGGNNLTDSVIPMEDMPGLDTIEVVEIIASGTDDEDVEHLRKRYYDSFEDVAFGGNQADYKQRAVEFEKVTACRVYPVWNGGGTVKLVMLGENYGKASSQVVSEIQEAFDPTQDGTGVGIAPIGHIVTVTTVEELPVNITCSISYVSGYAWDDIKTSFASSVADYFVQLREGWQDASKLIVRSGYIEALLLDIPGVGDVTRILLNGNAGNLTVPESQIPIVGDLNG